jgi:membrane protease YdiL (CAAX protease family)
VVTISGPAIHSVRSAEKRSNERIVMRLLKQLVVVAVVALAGGQAVAAAGWNTALTLVLGVATAVLALLAYAWIVRRTEHRDPVEVARKGALGALGRGLLIGLAVFGAVIANIWFLGDYRALGGGEIAGPIALVGFTAAAAVTEELIFRGVLFRILEGRIGTWLALIVTSLLFGAWHLPNPGSTVWSALAVAIEAGGMLGAAYAASRNLWVPIGLHFGWNFAEGAIFGTDISGENAPGGLLRSALTGPTPVTGGRFGPEGSLYALAAGVLVAAAFMWLARRRGNIVALRGRAANAEATATLVR